MRRRKSKTATATGVEVAAAGARAASGGVIVAVAVGVAVGESGVTDGASAFSTALRPPCAVHFWRGLCRPYRSCLVSASARGVWA